MMHQMFCLVMQHSFSECIVCQGKTFATKETWNDAEDKMLNYGQLTDGSTRQRQLAELVFNPVQLIRS